MSDQPPDLEDVWPYGFQREEGGPVRPLGVFTHLPSDPQLAMLLVTCHNTAVIADRLDSIDQALQRATDLLDRINDNTFT